MDCRRWRHRCIAGLRSRRFQVRTSVSSLTEDLAHRRETAARIVDELWRGALPGQTVAILRLMAQSGKPGPGDAGLYRFHSNAIWCSSTAAINQLVHATDKELPEWFEQTASAIGYRAGRRTCRVQPPVFAPDRHRAQPSFPIRLMMPRTCMPVRWLITLSLHGNAIKLFEQRNGPARERAPLVSRSRGLRLGVHLFHEDVLAAAPPSAGHFGVAGDPDVTTHPAHRQQIGRGDQGYPDLCSRSLDEGDVSGQLLIGRRAADRELDLVQFHHPARLFLIPVGQALRGKRQFHRLGLAGPQRNALESDPGDAADEPGWIPALSCLESIR